MEQNFQDIYEQLQSRIRQAEDKRLQLKAKGTKNGLIAGGITLVAGVVVSLIIGGGWPGILIACMLGLIVLFSCIQSKSGELCAYYKENIISSIISYLCKLPAGKRNRRIGLYEQPVIQHLSRPLSQ